MSHYYLTNLMRYIPIQKCLTNLCLNHSNCPTCLFLGIKSRNRLDSRLGRIFTSTLRNDRCIFVEVNELCSSFFKLVFLFLKVGYTGLNKGVVVKIMRCAILAATVTVMPEASKSLELGH